MFVYVCVTVFVHVRVCFGFKYSFIDNVKMKFISLEESWAGGHATWACKGGSEEAASWCKSV